MTMQPQAKPDSADDLYERLLDLQGAVHGETHYALESADLADPTLETLIRCGDIDDLDEDEVDLSRVVYVTKIEPIDDPRIHRHDLEFISWLAPDGTVQHKRVNGPDGPDAAFALEDLQRAVAGGTLRYRAPKPANDNAPTGARLSHIQERQLLTAFQNEQLLPEHRGEIVFAETFTRPGTTGPCWHIAGASISGQSGDVFISAIDGLPKFRLASGAIYGVTTDSERQIKARPPHATPFTLRDPASIPRREFLMGRHYIRQYMSATFGAGGGGKSANALVEALAGVTGRALLPDGPAAPLRVWYINLEDPVVEIERRLAGAAIHYRIDADAIGDRLFVDSGRDQEFVVVREERRETTIVEPIVSGMIAEIKARKIDVLIVDPFVSTHEVDENDNNKIQRVAAQWTRIADEANCSVELIHHVRKTTGEITADDGRGGGALKDKARSVRVINAMTVQQADEAHVAQQDRDSYFCVSHGKTNMATRGGGGAWRKFVSVKIGNGGKGNIAMLKSDEVGVVTSWSWPSAQSVADAVAPDALAAIKARIGGGDYRESDQATMWAGIIVADILKMDMDNKSEKKRVKAMLKTWTKAGHFRTELRADEKRTPRMFLVPVYADDRPPPHHEIL